MILTVHIGICDGNEHQVRGKQHNGLWLAGSAEWAALNNGAHWDQINKGYSFRWNWRNGEEEESRAYHRLRKMIFHNACVNSSKAFRIFLDSFNYVNQFFSLFIPASVNIFSMEMGQGRAYTTLLVLYYNVQTLSFIRSVFSHHLTSVNDAVTVHKLTD